MASTAPMPTALADGRDPDHRSVPRLIVMRLRAAEQHVLVVVGDADVATADQLYSHLVAALSGRPPSLLVDLAGLDFCDLRGLDALHDAALQAQSAGVQLTYRGMSPQLAWLHRTFPPPPLDRADPGPPHRSTARGLEASRHRAAGSAPAPDGLVHAVPPSDTTRSAVCGARVGRSDAGWRAETPGACPDCGAALAPTSA